MIGTILAHYRITAALGAGGMGEVWRATDEKLGREVALKVLPEEFVADPQRLDRFEREARAVAALNHPNIVTIHSVEQAGGLRFLTMELVDGRSLDKLIPEGGLGLEEFFELATPLAEAISAAHDKSVIHRDLKPANVMVDDGGRVKVLDFGLAKLQRGGEVSDSSEMATEALTGVGTIVGTVPYMSPEQIEAKVVDHRTDIFSLGVLLYEMATGGRPFLGESSPALMSSILKDVPRPVVEIRTDLPRHLGRVISRCLEKDRRDRYQTARDVFNELRALKRETSGDSLVSAQSRPRPAPARRGGNRAIAVAKFRAPSKSEELTALAEGLAEDIAVGLARFPYLTILEGAGLGSGDSSTSAAAGLGARYVLRGGLRSAGSELRLSVQLVEVETGAHVWSETYDRRLDEVGVFELQDDLTDRIVATVGDYSGVIPRLVVNELRAMDDDEMTVDDWIMRAVCYMQVIHPPEEHAAIRDGLEKMVELHPDTAEAHAWLSNTYVNEFAFGFNPLEDPIGRSLRAAQRAVDLDPTTQAGWLNLAGGHFFLGDLAAFEAAATRAIALNPRNSYAIAYMGLCFGNSGQRERGAQLGTRACDLNPHHPEWYPFVNFYHLYAREEYEAACSVIKGINWPKFPYTHINFAAACGQLGRPGEARTSIKTLRDSFGFDLEAVRNEFLKWGHTGDFIEHILDGLRKAGMDDDVGSPQSSVVNRPSQSRAVRPQADSEFDLESIVVLPFVNMSEDSANEFFADGVTEEILTSLSRIEGLRVISRTSAMTYKNTPKSIREIAAELEVGTVLEGSVRRAGNRVRVTAQLIEAASDRHLWSESYDRDLEDIFEVQSDVAVQIAQALQTELASDVVAQIRKRPTDSMEAYDLYLKGRQGVRTLVAPEVARGIEQLEQAIALDPDFAAAWAHLSLGHLFSAYWGAARGRDDYDEARMAADRALELDPSSALARVGRAGVRSHLDLDWDGAVADLRETIEIDPTEIDAYFWLGVTLFLMGRFGESVATHEIAYSMDPHSPNVISQLGLALCFAGRQEEGERMLRDGIEQHPVFFDLPNFLAIVLKRRNLFDEAARWYDRTSELTGRHPIFEAIRASNLKLAGEEGEARRVLDRLDEDDPRMDSFIRAMRAIAYRDIDGAVEYFSAAVDQRLPLVFWIRPAVHDKEFPTDHPGVRALWQRLWPQDPAFSKIEKPPETGSKAVAVLPFTDMSPGRDQEWFCEGVAEEILNALAAIPDLRVATRTAAFRFKDQDRDIAAIGQTLGVTTLLEGSVRTAGDRLRVTARLVNTDDGFQLWSEKFDREMAEVFEIQDQIAARVVEALEISVLGSAGVGGSERHSADIEAYHLFLRGRHARYSKLDLKTALECFEAAVRRDPSYSLARIGLAETLVVLSMYGFVPPHEGMTRARRELREAGDAAVESADAWAVEGLIRLVYTRNTQSAHEAFDRAIGLNPRSVTAVAWGSWALVVGDRIEEAIDQACELVALDPQSSYAATMAAVTNLLAGRNEEAIRLSGIAVCLEPDSLLGTWVHGAAHAAAGRWQEADEWLARAVERSDGAPVFLGLQAWCWAASGRQDAAREILDEMEERSATEYVSPYFRLWGESEFDSLEKARDLLGQAIAEHASILVFAGFPTHGKFRDEPLMQDLIRQMRDGSDSESIS